MTKEHRDVFISYHTNSALDLTKKIANELESIGISTWYAPRDCENQWMDAIMEAIKLADIFLLILNEGSSNSEQVKNEIAEAFNHFSNHKMSIVVFKIDDAPVSDSVRYLTGRFHYMNGKVPPIDDRIKELVYRIEYTKKNGNLFNLSEESRFVSTYISPNITFIGRQKELLEIDESLKKYHHISISGMGGIGKTDLIREYITRHRDEFRSLLWGSYNGSLKKLFCDDNAINVSNFFRNPPDEDDDSYFKRKIEFIKKHGEPLDLIVIDNFNTTNDIDLHEILSLPVSIFFATRNSQNSNGIYDIKLVAMEDDSDLFALFARNYPRSLNEEDKKTVLDIIHYLNGHTLSIILVAKLMRDKRINASKMLEILKTNSSESDSNRDFIYQNLTSLLNYSEINEEERKVLANLVFFPYTGISVEEFGTYTGFDNYEAIDNLIAKNWVLYSPSLDSISFHPLIAHMVNNQIGTKDEYVEYFLNYLIEQKLFRAKYLNAKEKSELLPLLERTLRYIRKESKYYYKLYLAAHAFFHAYARHLLNVKYLSLIVDDDNAPNDVKARAHSYLGDAYRCLHKSENLKREIDISNSYLDKIDDETLKKKLSIDNITMLGWYYTYLGEHQKALDAFTKQKEWRLSYFPDDDQNIGWAYFTMAMAMTNLGNYKEGIEGYLKSMEYFKKIKMDFAIANNNKAVAELYMKMGDFQNAKSYLESALTLFIDNIGEEHNDTALTKRDLVKVYRQLHINLELANKYETESKEILEKLGYVG